jgi:CheY-like chemotaxis protein
VNDPDLVIVDLKMDKKSGFDLAGEISRRPETSHIPVVAMTGHYWPGRHDSLMQVVGIRRCLTKPVDPAELMKVIGEVLEQGR